MIGSTLAWVGLSSVLVFGNTSPSVVRDSFPIFLTPSIRHGIDSTVSPCVDFDEFVNGRWRTETQLPDSLKSIDVFRATLHATELRLGQILDSLHQAKGKPSDADARVLGAYYETCLRADSIPRMLSGISMLRALPGDSSRQARCRRIVMHQFQSALGQIFVRETLTPAVESRMDLVVANVMHVLRARINGLNFLPADVKKRTFDALDYMTFKIAKPTDTIDFSNLALSDADFPTAYKRIQEYQLRQQFSKQTGQNKAVWTFSQFNANAHFSPATNSIEIPTFLFQWPFFYDDNGSEPMVSYAAAGVIIGHEMIHAITFKLGQEGEASIYEHPHLSRLVHQYTTLTLKEGGAINGRKTVNENLADLGGLLVAYDAWQRSDRTSEAATIDGFTPEQRFFIHYARMWRGKGERRVNAAHAPPAARINGVVRNVPAFAAAFGCKEGDPMALRADERVVIW